MTIHMCPSVLVNFAFVDPKSIKESQRGRPQQLSLGPGKEVERSRPMKVVKSAARIPPPQPYVKVSRELEIDCIDRGQILDEEGDVCD